MHKDVVGFGALNVDLIYELQDFGYLSEIREGIRKGEEYCINQKEFSLLLRLLNRSGIFRAKSGGGQAANTITALARIGFATGLVGAIGCDALGEFLINELKGVDINGITKKGKTGICIVVLDEKKERTMFVLPNANDHIKIDEIDYGYIASTKFLHLTSFVGQEPLLIQRKIATEIPDSVRISFDPGVIYSKRGISDLSEIIQRAFIIFLTETEARYLSGLNDCQSALEELLKNGPKIIVCKMGGKGSLVVTKSERYKISAFAVDDSVDSTGAGDVFAAGFLGGLIRGWSIEECGELGAKMASLSLAGYGRSSYPCLES
jgi:ribokinase